MIANDSVVPQRPVKAAGLRCPPTSSPMDNPSHGNNCVEIATQKNPRKVSPNTSPKCPRTSTAPHIHKAPAINARLAMKQTVMAQLNTGGSRKDLITKPCSG